jgi:glycine/D-amino acid oxidase-like deaminating enzyme
MAAHLRRTTASEVTLLEAGPQICRRASYANQARVHNGYHYPRSILTGYRSRVSFDRFCREYADCIHDEFDQIYAIAQRFSKVSAAQFQLFCERIGAPIEDAPERIVRLFNPDRIEAVFRVREVAFDAVALGARMARDLTHLGVDVQCRTSAQVVRRGDAGRLELDVETPAGARTYTAAQVVNCTYARLNQLLANSNLPLIPLKHQLAELCIVEVPDELRGVGITVMCGPFFSIMPFPALGLHSLSHVRYTPHCEWFDDPALAYRDAQARFDELPKQSNFQRMILDAQRYLPAVSSCRLTQSLFEIKTVLPRSEVDDSRPILFKRNCGLPGLTCITGSKIDNVYDVIDCATAVGAPPENA